MAGSFLFWSFGHVLGAYGWELSFGTFWGQRFRFESFVHVFFGRLSFGVDGALRTFVGWPSALLVLS